MSFITLKIHIKNDDEYTSVVICLKTLRAMTMPTRLYFNKYDRDDEYQIQFKLDSDELVTFDERNADLKRSQCKIQTLRSALIEYGDVKYLHHTISDINLDLKN